MSISCGNEHLMMNQLALGYLINKDGLTDNPTLNVISYLDITTNIFSKPKYKVECFRNREKAHGHFRGIYDNYPEALEKYKSLFKEFGVGDSRH